MLAIALDARQHHPRDGDDDERDADEQRHLRRTCSGDALSGYSNGFHEIPTGSGTPVYLPIAGRRTEAERRRSATGFNNGAELCLVRLEDGVDLGAVLDDLPGAAETGRDQEHIAGTEAAALAARVLDHYLPGSHDAQLVLGVAHTPFSARGRPAPGEELLARVTEIIAH